MTHFRRSFAKRAKPPGIDLVRDAKAAENDEDSCRQLQILLRQQETKKAEHRISLDTCHDGTLTCGLDDPSSYS